LVLFFAAVLFFIMSSPGKAMLLILLAAVIIVVIGLRRFRQRTRRQTPASGADNAPTTGSSQPAAPSDPSTAADHTPPQA
jgi:hypothetical protein